MKRKTGIHKLQVLVIVFAMIALILPSFSVSAFAAEDPLPEAPAESAAVSAQVAFADESMLGEVKQIRVPFPDVSDQVLEWDFPYSDAFFSLPSEEFSITMARGSLGLTMSAFRCDELD